MLENGRFLSQQAVLTRPVLRVIERSTVFSRIYVVTMPHYHRIPECEARITGRVKTARITSFTYRILIVYGRLRIVSFDLGKRIVSSPMTVSEIRINKEN